MAGISSLTVSSNTANSTYYLTGSFTPRTSSVLVAFVVASGTGAADAFLEITTQPWRRFALVTSAQWSNSTNSLYAFVANGPSTGAACVARFDCASDAATGSIIQVCEITSVSRVGTDLVRQMAVQLNKAASTRPNPTFGFNTSSINSIWGAVANSSTLAAMQPPTSWIEAVDTGYATPATGLESVYLNSGATSTVITWGSSSSSLNCSIIVEFNTTVPDTWMGAICDAEIVRVY